MCVKMISKVGWDRLLAVACAAVLGGILAAALSPFTSHPENQVTWLGNENGLRFGEHGTILSSGTFQQENKTGAAPCSLEIWIKPAFTVSSNTILSFYSRDKLISFSLHQNNDNLAIERRIRDRRGHVSGLRMYLYDLFPQPREVFVTITASSQGTALYVDGALARTASLFDLSSGDFTGQLVLANSPVESASWSGELRGLAIFDRELTATEALENFHSWIKKGRPEFSGKAGPVALYLFDERAGSVIHNRAGSGPDLYIPDHYLIAHPVLLEYPWNEYYPSRSYFKNIVINIGGFLPLGFVFCAYLSSARHLKRPRLMTILLGFTVSLTIEILQAFIPTRDSGMTDIITNTLGTAIGATAFQWEFTRALFSRIGIPIEQ
jgi:VanZ family protein